VRRVWQWDPRAWSEVIRPNLADRQGWAAFAGTPNGLNHFFDMWRAAQSDGEWYTLRLRASETGLLPQAELVDARRQMSEEQYNAEFEASFEASTVGTVFGKAMDTAEREGRICAVPWQPELAVSTWWDLGTSDATAIWFTQDAGREVHVIDYYENAGAGVGIDHYIERAIAVGLELLAARQLVPDLLWRKRCWFDREKTERGRLALTSYRYQWDEKRKVFSTEPYHDWASHGSDAWQCLAMAHTGRPARFGARGTPENPLPLSPREPPVPTGPYSWLGV
jgi:phage terminase large subunit